MTHIFGRARAAFAPFALLAAALAIIPSPRLAAQPASHPIRIAVDLRDAPRHIFHARLEFPVSPGPLTLVYPKWIPGEHSPSGHISDLAGIQFSAADKSVAWRRDDEDMFAFHCEIPQGADTLSVSVDYLSPSSSESFLNSPASSAQLAVFNWYKVVLYPQGAKSDDLTYAASIRVPTGWKFATALVRARETPDEIVFEPVSLTTLMDSTVLTGAFFRTIDLSPGQSPAHRLNIAADSAAATEVSPEQVAAMKQLVAEAGAIFGAHHYRKYDFLHALSDYISAFGEEHHESSDNRESERYLLDAEYFEGLADLLPHEFFHSWNGKYRRPAGLATPNFQAPMRGELLWVYEGLTNYYGYVLAERSGLWTPDKFREDLAYYAAGIDQRPGRAWRDLQDTAVSAQILYAARVEGSSWRRREDFYDESSLFWLDADAIIRKQTQGRRSLDDFCRKFHGGQDTPPQIVPYTFDDVVAALNEIAPYDWRTFFTERLASHGPGGPLGGLAASGWRLVYTSVPNGHQRALEAADHYTNVGFTLGFSVDAPGGDTDSRIREVIVGTPAAHAGIAPGARLVAVNGRRWSPEGLHEAIRVAKTSAQPIELLIENEEYFQTFRLDYHDGERYPHLERVSSAPDLLADILRPRAPASANPGN